MLLCNIKTAIFSLRLTISFRILTIIITHIWLGGSCLKILKTRILKTRIRSNSLSKGARCEEQRDRETSNKIPICGAYIRN